jgi:hypothetical protein
VSNGLSSAIASAPGAEASPMNWRAVVAFGGALSRVTGKLKVCVAPPAISTGL